MYKDYKQQYRQKAFFQNQNPSVISTKSCGEIWNENKSYLSFPELQQQWSNQTLFRILTTDVATDACQMLLSLQMSKTKLLFFI